VGAADRELVAAAPEVRTQPDDDYIEDVAVAAGVVESFSQMNPPAGLMERLGRDVLVAQSRLWWGDPTRLAEGSAFAAAARAEVDRELGKISVFGQQNITLTSRRGEIPLNLVNGTNYDVTAEISIESFDRDITLDEHTIEDTFSPGATFLPVQATARAGGVFLIQIRVLTPDGLTIDETTVSIRSTEFNEIALGITVGALAFLVMFYMFRGLGRRRAAAVRAGD
jgi:hypothetical protein